MKNTIRLVKDYNLGGLNLLPGTVLVSTDAMSSIEAYGIGVRINTEGTATTTAPEVGFMARKLEEIEAREPQVQNREPKIRKSRFTGL